MGKRKLPKFISATALFLALILSIPACAPNTTNSGDNGTNGENDGDTNSEYYDSGYLKESIPKLYLSTDNGEQVTSKKEYSDVTMRIELNERYSQYTNTYTDDMGGAAQLRCRGNSSYGNKQLQSKNMYSYKLKLSQKSDLLGMGANRHWYLIANWFDVTHMRNKLAYDLSGSLGMTYTESTWVVLYYNGEYRGLYLLCESIRIDEGRVETFDWEDYAERISKLYALDAGYHENKAAALSTAMKADLSWITTQNFSFTYKNTKTNIDLSSYFSPKELDLTSGYLIEYDSRLDSEDTTWLTEGNIPVMLVSPASLNSNGRMYSYVKTLIQDFEDAILSPTYHNAKGKHYSEYVDVDSMVDFWLVWTIFNNIEFGNLSMYYYIDNGKIVFGPCWDFDNASGNIVTLNEKWEKWDRWNADRGGTYGWFKNICSDPYFTSLCQTRYFEIRSLLDDMVRSLDIYYYYLRDEAIKGYEVLGPRNNWYLSVRNGGISLDFEKDFKLLKNWLKNHIGWLDENLALTVPNIDDSGYVRDAKLSAVAFSDGKALAQNKVTSYGVLGDCVLSSDTDGKITIRVITSSTSGVRSSVYMNGTSFLGLKECSSGTHAVYTVDTSDMDMTNGALNVFHILLYKSDGTIRAKSSLVIRISDSSNPASGESAITFGDTVILAKKNSTITVPEINESREGFTALGWSTLDGKLYKPGKSYTVDGNEYLFIRWKRTDMHSLFIVDSK